MPSDSLNKKHHGYMGDLFNFFVPKTGVELGFLRQALLEKYAAALIFRDRVRSNSRYPAPCGILGQKFRSAEWERLEASRRWVATPYYYSIVLHCQQSCLLLTF